VKNNAILPITRAALFVVVPFLLIAFMVLFFLPDRTGQLFAWAIGPHMSSMYIGAAYLGGAWILAQGAIGIHWHRVQAVFPAVTVFATAMLISTLLHWDKFSLGTLPFDAWLILYILAPLLIPALWFYNKRTDSGQPEASDVKVSIAARVTTRIIGTVILLLVLTGFIDPVLPMGIWPWTLTALTARVLCGWLSVIGVSAWMLSFDTRWTAWRGIFEGIFISYCLILTATVINSTDFKTSIFNWHTVFVLALLLCISIFYLKMEAQRRNS
jgi:hypothetical protein